MYFITLEFSLHSFLNILLSIFFLFYTSFVPQKGRKPGCCIINFVVSIREVYIKLYFFIYFHALHFIPRIYIILCF